MPWARPCWARVRPHSSRQVKESMSTNRPAGESLLIYPPFADPTWPYVSLPTLKGYLGRRGIEVQVRDLNVEAISFLTEASTIARWRQQLTARFQELNGRETLTLSEQMEYWRVAQALPLFQDFGAAVKTMRDGEGFYDRAAYAAARDSLEELFRIMEAVCFRFVLPVTGRIIWWRPGISRYWIPTSRAAPAPLTSFTANSWRNWQPRALLESL